MKLMQPHRGVRRWSALLLASLLLGLGMPNAGMAQAEAPAEAPQEAQTPQQAEPVSTSSLTGISLPPAAQRLTDPGMLAQFTQKLQGLAKLNKKGSAAPEVLVWGGPGYRRDKAPLNIADVVSEMKGAGYSYIEKEVGANSAGRVLVAQKEGRQIAGFWLISDRTLLLAWCRLVALNEGAVPKPVQTSQKASPAANTGAGGEVGADSKAAAVRAVTAIYQQQCALCTDLAHYDNDQFFAAYDPDFHETKADGTVKDLAQMRREQQEAIQALRKLTVHLAVVKSDLYGDTLTVQYNQTAHVEMAPTGGGSGKVGTVHERGEDTWRRKGGAWKLIASRILPDGAGGDTGDGKKPHFKQHATERELAMYKMLPMTLVTGGYLADLDNNGVLTLFNSVGTKLFTLPPRQACSDMFQYYVDKSMTKNIETQIQLMGTSDLEGGHRGISQRLHRDAYFTGANPNDEFNHLVFVFSDTNWE